MSRCRRCKVRAVHNFTARRGLCLQCAAQIDAERAGLVPRLCVECKTRVASGGGRRCERCRCRRPEEPLPEDFAARMRVLDARVDPLATPLTCWCGRESHIESRYVARLCESRCLEVCPAGHRTLMRLHGTHTYDQREREAADQERWGRIVEQARETKRRNGTENPRSS